MTVKPDGKASISRHPAFPAVVALWFAALLGLGSLAIRTSIIENAVLAAHIDALVPAAAPPLGFTARLLLSGGMALAGAIAGFVLARLLARSGGRSDVRPAAPVPSSPVKDDAAHDDNDDLARLDAARERAAPLRRRALSLEDTAPAVLRIDDLADIDEVAAVADVATPDASAPADEPAAHVELPVVEADPQAHGPDDMAARIAPEAAAELQAAPLSSLAVPQLVQRFALALAARRRAAPPSFMPPLSTPPSPGAVAPQSVAPERWTPPPALVAAPAVVEPVPPPFAPPATPAILPEPEALAPGPEGERPFDMPPSMREPGLGNIDWFDDVEEEVSLESLLPPKRPSGRIAFGQLPDDEASAGGDAFASPDIAAEAARWALPDPEGEPVDEDDLVEEEDAGPFSSLLAMKSSFVRVEDETAADIAEPVVTYPGQTPPPPPIPARLPGSPFGATPVETEAALREALTALQKMSGAA